MSTSHEQIPSFALIGITGYGAVYWKYVRKFVERKMVRLSAAVVINPEEAQEDLAEIKAHGTRIYSGYPEMIEAEAGKVDVCLIPTGIHWHARMAIAALEAGMNVLVEKPLAGSLADARSIRRAEKASGCWVAVGFQDMYLSEANWLKSKICSGAIGRLQRVRMVGLWPRPPSYYKRNRWAGELSFNGVSVLDSPLNNAFAHFVNLSLFFAGTSIARTAKVQPTVSSLWRAHDIKTFDTGFVRAESSDGVLFEFFVSHCCSRALNPEIVLEGTEGRAEWIHDESASLFPKDGKPILRSLSGGNKTSREAMFAAILRRIKDPSEFICDSEMAESHTAFIDSLHRNATIREISPGQLDWIPSRSGGSVPAVRGLPDRLREGMKAETLESGFLPILLDLVSPGSGDSRTGMTVLSNGVPPASGVP